MFALITAVVLSADPSWREVSPGIEYATFKLVESPKYADGVLHVVRMDPSRVVFEFGVAGRGGSAKTADQWAAERAFAVTINAGMFELDAPHLHSGYFKYGERTNNSAWRSTYASVFVTGPTDASLPSADVLDRDAPGFASLVEKYESAVQNLRLIKGTGVNVWKKNGRHWSEAALGRDAKGRILFVFSRSPLQMAEFNDRLLALPLGLTHLQHVEGGPEASLTIRSKSVNVSLNGSYETGFVENDDVQGQLYLPNVIGVRSR